MLRRQLLLSITLLGTAHLAGCALSPPPGPGMIVTYTSLIEGRSIDVKSAKLPSGADFAHAGSFGGRRHQQWRGGATMGASGDRRQLPEWVEFAWSEPPYPEDPKQSLAEYRALPRKTQRVPVRERIPLDIVQEAIASRDNAKPGKTPALKLWVYFVWTDHGIKLHWELYGTEPLREGGDDIDAYYRTLTR